MLKKQYESEDRSLRLELSEDDKSIRLLFRGKSTGRSPADFINPVIQEALTGAETRSKAIILDFYYLEYMNSSTVAPLIKLWARLKDAGIRMVVEFNNELPWQKTNFMAFAIFEKESELFTLHAR